MIYTLSNSDLLKDYKKPSAITARNAELNLLEKLKELIEFQAKHIEYQESEVVLQARLEFEKTPCISNGLKLAQIQKQHLKPYLSVSVNDAMRYLSSQVRDSAQILSQFLPKLPNVIAKSSTSTTLKY